MKFIYLIMTVVSTILGPLGCSSGFTPANTQPTVAVKTPAITSAILTSTQMSMTGSNLDQITSLSISQDSSLFPLSIVSQTASLLIASFQANATLAKAVAPLLLIHTAQAQTSVTLTINLSGTTIADFTSTGITDLGTSTVMTISSAGAVGIGTASPLGILDLSATGTLSSLVLPRDTTAHRNAAPVNGMMRYNTNFNKFEGFANGVWASIDTSSGATGAYVNGGNNFGGTLASLGTTGLTNLNVIANNSPVMTLTTGGNVGVGTASPSANLDVETQNTLAAGASNAMLVNTTWNPSTAAAVNSSLAATNFTANTAIGGTQSLTNGIIQGEGGSVIHQNAQTLGSMYGNYGSASNNASGTVSNGYGALGVVSNNSNGTITNAYGMWTQVGNGTGTITNGYGLYVDAVQGTNVWAIFTADASPSFFGGSVGIGTTTPGEALQIGIHGDGSAGLANAWNLYSDARLKNVIGRIPEACNLIDHLNGYYYTWKSGADQSRQIGVLAQEVAVVLPELVRTGGDGMMSVDYSKLTAVLIEAVKQLHSETREIPALKNENAAMKAYLCAKDPVAPFCN